MRATIEGKYLSTRKGTGKNGKEYCYSKLLIGDNTYNVFRFDGSKLADYEDIVLTVDVFSDERGLKIINVGEGS